MAKGSGLPKARPRKIPILSEKLQDAFTPVLSTAGECSIMAETAGMIQTPINGPVTFEDIKQTIELELQLDLQSLVLKQEELQKEGKKEAEVLKIEEGEIPPLRKRGMALGYVAPILKQGIPTAQLCVAELEKEAGKWKNAIILYVIRDTPTISYLLQKQCEIAGNIELFYHNE